MALWIRYLVLSAALLFSSFVTADESFVWSIAPSYESPVAFTETALSFDGPGDLGPVELYTQSHAVLIIQGKYEQPWDSPVQGAAISESLLVRALEDRKFHVLVWRDVNSKTLNDVINDVTENFADSNNERLFFYYYGHGVTKENQADGKSSFFLVPTDAPAADSPRFLSRAFSGQNLVEKFNFTGIKHGFFAFEACYSGGILSSLDGVSKNSAGYLLSDGTHARVHQYLTAGTELQSVKADAAFSAALVGAMSSSSADSNKDNYITGSELAVFVSGNIKQYDTIGVYASGEQSPEFGRTPLGSAGDFIFGPWDPTNFNPYFRPEVEREFTASVSAGYEAISEAKYETAERNIAPFAALGEKDGLFAMATLAARREHNPSEKVVVKLILDAALAGHQEARRIIAVLRQIDETALPPAGDLISDANDDGRGFDGPKLLRALRHALSIMSIDEEITIERLSDENDPFALLVQHLTVFEEELAAHEKKRTQGLEPPAPMEVVTPWLVRAAALGYAPAEIRLALVRSGIEAYWFSLDYPMPPALNEEDVLLLFEAAEAGYSEATYLLTQWRTERASQLPGLPDRELFNLFSRFDTVVVADESIALSTDDFRYVGLPKPEEFLILSAIIELLASVEEPNLVLAERLLVHLGEVVDREDDPASRGFSRWTQVRGALLEAKGDYVGAFDSFASDNSGWQDYDWMAEDLLRVGARAGWSEERRIAVRKTFDNLRCIYRDCEALAGSFVDGGDIQLSTEFAIAMQALLVNGEFSGSTDMAKLQYAAYAKITRFVIARDVPKSVPTLDRNLLRSVFEAGAKQGYTAAKEWLQAEGFDVPEATLPKVNGPFRAGTWRYTSELVPDRGPNCYVSSNELRPVSGSRRSLIAYFFVQNRPGNSNPSVYILSDALEAEAPSVIALGSLRVGGKVDVAGKRVNYEDQPNILSTLEQSNGVMVTLPSELGGTQSFWVSLDGFAAAYRDMAAACTGVPALPSTLG